MESYEKSLDPVVLVDAVDGSYLALRKCDERVVLPPRSLAVDLASGALRCVDAVQL